MAKSQSNFSPADGPAARIATVIATGLGAGLSPVAPGTAGTVVAIPIGYGLLGLSPLLQLVAIALVVAVAIWSAGVAAGRLGVKDPGQVVIDEVAGYLVAVALMPPTWRVLAAAFFFFRAFDIAKPPPCRWAEGLPGGIGIVVDDLFAGLYANLAIRALGATGLFSP
ncbi:MAG TPA: phosphatidylglycerophosphatase A [Candidatus Binatia bacterium]